MQLTVSGKQIDLSDALQTHVQQQLATITAKYFDHALEANVTFSKARSFFTCDINVHAGRNITVRGEGEAADAHAAFDDAAEHIATRLRRYRRRVSEHARDASAKPGTGRQYVLRAEEGNEPEAEQLHATIIAESDAVIETLSVRDAVMRMDLAFQPVLMFRNANNGQLNVIHRRADGHVGWIDPH